jgi:tetratricopeptide (TPR) repeat protein
LNYELASISSLLKRFDDQVRYSSVAVALRPRSPRAHLELGQALTNSGDVAGAAAAYRRAIELAPDLATAHVELGLNLRRLGDIDGAVASYRRAIELEPDGLLTNVAYDGLALVLESRGDLAGAVETYRRAIELNPRYASTFRLSYARAYSGLGGVLLGRGDLAGAEAAYRGAIGAEPDRASHHAGLGIVLRDSGDVAGAEASFRRTIELEANHVLAHIGLGDVLRSRGDLAGAEASYRRAIELEPDLATAHVELGLTLRDRGDVAGAEASFRRAIDELTGPVPVRIAVNYSPDALVRRANELKPVLASANCGLGDALRDRGDVAGAIAAYRRAIEQKPDLALAHCNLGMALKRLGQFSESLAALRRGHELGSKQRNWANPSVEWVRSAERLIALESRLPKVLSGEDAPRDADVAVGLAELCYYTGRHRAAARLYEKALVEYPKLANELDAGHRYNAACAAALAGIGKGEDVPPLDDAARNRWRERAREWLRADLAAWGKPAEGTPKERQQVKATLAHWKVDVDLAGLRDPDALAKLPEAEREEWRKLWADVDALLKRAGEPPAK